MEQSVVTFCMISRYFSRSEARQMSRPLARKIMSHKSVFTKRERERQAYRHVNIML
jgi:hypothetical protein